MEVTTCSEGGIHGYTTYRLSVTIQPNLNIKNIDNTAYTKAEKYLSQTTTKQKITTDVDVETKKDTTKITFNYNTNDIYMPRCSVTPVDEIYTMVADQDGNENEHLNVKTFKDAQYYDDRPGW